MIEGCERLAEELAAADGARWSDLSRAGQDSYIDAAAELLDVAECFESEKDISEKEAEEVAALVEVRT
jgi:hypothetical protein